MRRVLSELALPESVRHRIAALAGITYAELPAHEPQWEMPQELVAGTEILMCRRPPLNLDRLTDLKLIQLTSVGYEHLRHLQMADRPVRVCNARGVFDTAIAEWNLAMMVNLLRDLRGQIRNQEAAIWERAPRFTEELHGRTVGLWGYGGIGRATARVAKAFGMTVHVLTRAGVVSRSNTYVQPGSGDPEGVLPDRAFVLGQETEFLAGLDFLILALPHTQHSDGMIGERELGTLRRTAFVLNPARGPIIQEQALLGALRAGTIAGAALDTHYVYPLPPDHPLWRMPNVILTPHISGSDKSSRFLPRMGDLLAQNVVRYHSGQPLLNELTRREWRES